MIEYKLSYTGQEINQKLGKIDKAVLYTEQHLTDEYKDQARKNIDAVSIEDVEALLNGGNNIEFSETGELVRLDVDIEVGTELNVISKIHRDSTWGESNKLVLHQVSGDNFVDLSSYLGGVGTVFEVNGLTAIINENKSLTVTGTNTSTGWTNVFNKYFYNTEYEKRIYPAGTYIIPNGLTINIKAARYPAEVSIAGTGVNLYGKITIPEPFRIINCYLAYAGGASVNTTIPLGLFRCETMPNENYEYNGSVYTATFDRDVYEGEYNWTTGELKDVDGNTIAYYEPQSIKSLSGVNYFWTCFGENTVSNKSNNVLERAVITLGKVAPKETIPSICDFTLTPTTKNYSINVRGDSRDYFNPENNLFYGLEFPLITTRGKFVVIDSDGLYNYEVQIPELINYNNISDTMTCNNVIKRWSERFYITRDPDFYEIVDDGSGATMTNPNTIATWIFTKKEFENFGLPIESSDIQIISPVFTSVTDNNLMSTQCFFSNAYIASFSYDETNDNYVFKCRARDFHMPAIYKWTKGYFCYPLKEEIHRDSDMLSLYISAGYSVRFEQDDAFDVFWEYALTQNWCPFFDASGAVLWNPNTKPVDVSAAKSFIDVTPNVAIFVPRSIEDALFEAEHIAKRLNHKVTKIDDYEQNNYGWIGKGDGKTDYTEKIQSKLTEIHNTTDGGTIYLGAGTYPITRSLIIYDNTRIIGNGQTIIDQTSDNTHAIILSGSNITISDLIVKLSGACTVLTACMFVNSGNHPLLSEEEYDSAFPENMYGQNITINNVTMTGTYKFDNVNGYAVISDDYENYKGVGIHAHRLYFNYAHVDNVLFEHLMSGIYGGSGSNYFNITSKFCKYGLYIIQAGDNTYFVNGHPDYAIDENGNYITMSDAIAYVKSDNCSTYHLRSFDGQGYHTYIFLDSKTDNNKIDIQNVLSCGHSLRASHEWDILKYYIIDYGRANTYEGLFKNTPFHIGSHTTTIAKAPQLELSNPVIQNALSGAGIWGNISSNIEFGNHGMSLSDVCRYPKEKTEMSNYLPYILSTTSPTESNPIEIVIDYSNRPVIGIPNYFIQFYHDYVASDFVVSFDTTNTGVYDFEIPVTNNTNIVEFFDYPQVGTEYISYRMKFSFTKPLQIANLETMQQEEVFDYNPQGLIGICNLGMTVNDYAGRSFLGECGGSLYGNVDMHQNTLKNLPDPVDDGDAVSKSYLNDQLENFGNSGDCLYLVDRTTEKKYTLYIDNGRLMMEEI